LTFDESSKIKRIIFSTARKWNGSNEEVVPLAEIKQLAGRAGRYGMHGPDSVGIVTSLLPGDHPIVENALKSTVPRIETAVIAADNSALSRIHRCLPPNAGLGQVYQLLDLAVCEKPFSLIEYQKLLDPAVIVDDACPGLGIPTRAMLTQTPVPWNIPEAVQVFKEMLVSFAAGVKVDGESVFEKLGFMLVLEDVNEAREEYLARGNTSAPEKTIVIYKKVPLSVREAATRLKALELLHKMACVYLWLSYRYPVAFYNQERMKEIKLACELGIQFCLEMVQSERGKAMKKRIEGRRTKVSRVRETKTGGQQGVARQ